MIFASRHPFASLAMRPPGPAHATCVTHTQIRKSADVSNPRSRASARSRARNDERTHLRHGRRYNSTSSHSVRWLRNVTVIGRYVAATWPRRQFASRCSSAYSASKVQLTAAALKVHSHFQLGSLMGMQTVFVSVYASSAYSLLSLPMPLCLYPPNGRAASKLL